MTKWPSTIPHDLDMALNQLAQHRADAANSDVWGVVQDWLQHHGVNAPAGLPTGPETPHSD